MARTPASVRGPGAREPAGQARRLIVGRSVDSTGEIAHGEAGWSVRLARLFLLLGIVGGNDSKPDDLRGRRSLGDLVVKDQGQVVIARCKALERDRVFHVEQTRRLFALGLVLVHFQFLQQDVFLTALADLKAGDEMSLVAAVDHLGLEAQGPKIDQQLLVAGLGRLGQDLVIFVAVDCRQTMPGVMRRDVFRCSGVFRGSLVVGAGRSGRALRSERVASSTRATRLPGSSDVRALT